MRIIDTASLDITKFSKQETLWIYGGLDSMITREIWDEQRDQLDPETTGAIYNFEKSLQGPALCMMMRGFRVDNARRLTLIAEIEKKLHKFGGMEKNAKGRWEITNPEALIQQYAVAMTGDTLNYNSSLQLKKLLYTTLKIPNYYHWAKGKKTLSTKREILEKISLIYMRATPIIEVLLRIRDMEKELSVLNSKPDADGRWRTSFKPAGTETGRWSSSLTAFKRGFQAQNVTHALREIFIPDDGFVMFYADLKTAESMGVAYLSEDENYIEACKSNDLHTIVAKLVWRKLNWVNDNGPLDRKVAEGPYYRHFSYRDMSKRGGHGCLTGDHEVLTRDGWKFISNVSDNEKILTWSKDKMFFERPSHWERKAWKGDLIQYKGLALDLTMTPDHRVIHYKDHRYEPQEHPAIDKPKWDIPLGWGYVGGNQVVPPRLLAAFQSDGSQKSKNRMEFHLKKERKIKRLETLCKFYGFIFEKRDNNKFIVYGSLPKKLDASCLNWTKETIIKFMEEYSFWDGHRSKTSTQFFSSDYQQIEWLQTLNRLIGKGGNIKKYISGYGNKPTYRLQQNNRKFATGRKLKYTKIANISTRVYCPTVSTGAFLVRKNGKICVTGNSNYLGTPKTMAMHLRCEQKMIKRFQTLYFGGTIIHADLVKWGAEDMVSEGKRVGNIYVFEGAFPGIRRWHANVRTRVERDGRITTPTGRVRRFWGRPTDDTTIRGAVAHEPQSLIADILNTGLFWVWYDLDGPDLQILAQGHDAILGQVRASEADRLIPEVIKRMEVPIDVHGRTMTIRADVKLGSNWKEIS